MPPLPPSPCFDAKRRDGDDVVLSGELSARDLFIRDHRVGASCAAPGSWLCDMIAEAARTVIPAARVHGLEEVRFEQLLRVADRVSVEARARVEPARGHQASIRVAIGSRFSVPARPEMILNRAHAEGVALVGRGEPPPLRMPYEGAEPMRDYAPLYEHRVGSELGPSFRLVQGIALHERGADAHVRAVDEDAFTFGPCLLDAVFQVAATAAIAATRRFAIPTGLTRLTLGTRPRAELHVSVRGAIEGDVARYRIRAHENGQGFVDVEGFALKLLDPFPDEAWAHFARSLSIAGEMSTNAT